MELEFHGAAAEVTGSAHLLRFGQRQVLIDCGMRQGGKEEEKRNRKPFAFDPRRLDAVVATHAHIDHVGLLPKLVRDGYRGPVHATAATVELAKLLLMDSARIAEGDAERGSRRARRAGKRPLPPLYTVGDAEAASRLFIGHAYAEEIEIVDGLRVRFRDAGHILGSAFLEAVVRENGATRRIAFSGDIGNTGQAVIRDPETPSPADVVLIESTYGDRLHKSRPDTLNELSAVLDEAYRDRGNVVIPAFAVGRTQEILYRLRELAEAGRLPPFRVYVDSPLAIDVTKVVRDNPACFDEETLRELAQHHDPLAPPNLSFTRDAAQSQAINFAREPGVIISANGMCSAGRILHHLKHNLWRRESHIVIVGFQGVGTLGRALVDGAPRVRIMGESIAVAAKIHTIGGLSAHADQAGLLAWLAPLAANKPRTFVVHGEPPAAVAFAQAVNGRFGYLPETPTLSQSETL
jgi:metallo-beta-lactamase family protein